VNDRIDYRERASVMVMGQLDAMLRDGDFDGCRSLLASLNVGVMRPTATLTVLGITLAAKDRLNPERADYAARVRAALVETLGEERAVRLVGRFE